MRLLVGALLALTVVLPASAKPPAPPPAEPSVFSTGRGPCGIAAQAGSIWIGVYETGKLLRLDADNGRREATIDVGRWSCRVAVGPAAVWVTRDNAGELVRVSRDSRRIARIRVGTGAFDVVLARGSAWVTSFDTGIIARVDTRTAEATRIYKDGPNPAGITYCRGAIWVGHGRNATWLTRIDPVSHRVRRVDAVLKSPGWPRCIRDELWVTTIDSVLEIDARKGRLVGHYELGGTPAEAAAGPDGLVWVTDKQRSLIHRIDPAARRVVDAFAAGPGAYALARVGDAMWVTSFAGADVRRFER